MLINYMHVRISHWISYVWDIGFLLDASVSRKPINHGVTCKTIIGLPYNTLTHLFFQRRLTREEPFTVSDVDFTRALYIREAVAEKRDYIYFFTCLRADVSYFLCCKRCMDVCVTPSLIVFSVSLAGYSISHKLWNNIRLEIRLERPNTTS